MKHVNLYESMRNGNEKQQRVYRTITELNIMNDLEEYKPTLCGTIPIGVDIESSDLDIIMDVNNLDQFEIRLITLYSNTNNFMIKRKSIRGNEVVKANFFFNNFEFELFGQSLPVHEQHAYLHMIIEYELLQINPDLKKKVMDLKKIGYKTEPAFCELLGIKGDPYIGLIRFGIEKMNIEYLN